MPSIELNIGQVPSPRRARDDRGDEGDGAAPFRVLVLGDFSGRPTIERPPLAQRRGVRVDIDRFEAVFSRFAPVAAIAGLQDANGGALKIALESFDDFSADALLARLPAGAMARLAASLRAGAPAASPTPAPAPAAVQDEDAAETMRRLLGGSVAAGSPAAAPAPATKAASASESIDRFVRQLVGAHVVPPAAPAAAASHDGAAVVLRHVLRDPSWRGLECAWRAVDRCVRGPGMADGQVRLELLDVRADEVLDDLSASGADPARAALAGALGGDGRGCDLVVSLEEFGPSAVEMSLLGGLALLAASQGAVLLASAAPALAAVATSEDEAVRATPEARVWQALRASPLAGRIGLAFPRLLARLPYGPRDEPVSAFPFDELGDSTGPVPHEHLLWRSAALDLAQLLALGHVEGGAAGVETRVELDDLPAFVDRRGDEPRLQAVAETYLGEALARALQAAGFLTLQSDRRVPEARVSGWRSIATGNVALQGSWRDA